MTDRTKGYSLAIHCQEVADRRVTFHVAAGFVIADSVEEAAKAGVLLCQEKWLDFVNHNCEVLEIPPENTRYSVLEIIIKAIGNKMKRPSPDKADHPMVIGGQTVDKNTPEDVAFNDGLLTAEEIVFSALTKAPK